MRSPHRHSLPFVSSIPLTPQSPLALHSIWRYNRTSLPPLNRNAIDCGPDLGLPRRFALGTERGTRSACWTALELCTGMLCCVLAHRHDLLDREVRMRPPSLRLTLPPSPCGMCCLTGQDRLTTYAHETRWGPAWCERSRWRLALWRSGLYWLASLLRLCVHSYAFPISP